MLSNPSVSAPACTKLRRMTERFDSVCHDFKKKSYHENSLATTLETRIKWKKKLFFKRKLVLWSKAAMHCRSSRLLKSFLAT